MEEHLANGGDHLSIRRNRDDAPAASAIRAISRQTGEGYQHRLIGSLHQGPTGIVPVHAPKQLGMRRQHRA